MMKRRTAFNGYMIGFAAFCALFFTARSAQAYIELNAFYLSDSLATTSTTASTKMFVEGSVGFAIDRKGSYLVGWNYSLYSTSDSGSSTDTYSSTQMGPRFLFMLDKEHHWSLGLGYYLVTTASFNLGGSGEQQWKGSAFKVDAGYSMDLTETVKMGLRLNYSSATYSEQLVGDTDYSKVSYSRSHIFPSVYTMIVF